MANQNQKTEGKPLDDYTVAELRAMGEDKGIEIPSHATKDEIIKALEKAGAKAEGQSAGVTPLALTGPVIPLPLAGKVADAYGEGNKYNIQLADIQACGAVLQANLLLDTLPPGEIMQLVRIKHSQSVAGPAITAVTAQVTDGVNAAFGAAFDVFQAPAAGALSTAQLAAANVGNFGAVNPVYLTLVAVGANLGVATTGAISVWLRYVLLA